MFLFLAELLFLALFLVLFFTQVLIPLYRGTPLFPVFQKETGLSIKLAEERERLIEREIQKQIKQKSKEKP